MASNIGGTATLIGDPPNAIIAGAAGLSFDEFIVNLAPVVVLDVRSLSRPRSTRSSVAGSRSRSPTAAT